MPVLTNVPFPKHIPVTANLHKRVLGCLQYVRQDIKEDTGFWIAMLSSLLENFHFLLQD